VSAFVLGHSITQIRANFSNMHAGDAEAAREPWLSLTWGLAALATVVLSFLPMALFTWASGAVLRLF